jgi:hypothetical protein
MNTPTNNPSGFHIIIGPIVIWSILIIILSVLVSK